MSSAPAPSFKQRAFLRTWQITSSASSTPRQNVSDVPKQTRRLPTTTRVSGLSSECDTACFVSHAVRCLCILPGHTFGNIPLFAAHDTRHKTRGRLAHVYVGRLSSSHFGLGGKRVKHRAWLLALKCTFLWRNYFVHKTRGRDINNACAVVVLARRLTHIFAFITCVRCVTMVNDFLGKTGTDRVAVFFPLSLSFVLLVLNVVGDTLSPLVRLVSVFRVHALSAN